MNLMLSYELSKCIIMNRLSIFLVILSLLACEDTSLTEDAYVSNFDNGVQNDFQRMHPGTQEVRPAI